MEFKPVKGFVRGGEGGMVLTDQEKVVKGGCMYVVPQRRLGTSPFFQMGGSSLVVRGLGLLEQQQRTRQGVSRVTEGVQKQYLHGTARPSAGQNGMGRTKKMEMVVFAAAGDWLLR